MKFKFLVLTAAFGIFIYGCSKNNNSPIPVQPTPKPKPTTNDTLKITIISGNNQSAQIGYPLQDSIYVKVTKNGNAVSNDTVQFIGSGCNEDLITTIHTKSDGTASYSWILAGNGGAQTLRAVVIQNKQRVDSVIVNASASTLLTNPPRAACTPHFGYTEQFAMLSTGRLLACFSGTNSIRYSDDNGASWNPLKNFGSNHVVTKLLVSYRNGIFAATKDDGLFYSGNAGNTWTDVTPPNLDKHTGIYDMSYDYFLTVTGAPGNFYISYYDGSYWEPSVGAGLPSNATYVNPVMLKTSQIFLLSSTNVIYHSNDRGLTWTAIANPENVHITALCRDTAGWFYKASMLTSTTAPSSGVYVSKDNGATFTTLLNYTNPGNQPYIVDMSIQPDGLFYYGQLSYAISRLQINGQITNYALSNIAFAPYMLAKNNHLIYATLNGIFY